MPCTMGTAIWIILPSGFEVDLLHFEIADEHLQSYWIDGGRRQSKRCKNPPNSPQKLTGLFVKLARLNLGAATDPSGCIAI